MHILHSGSLDVKTGGPALSTYLSIKGLIRGGVDTEIIMPPIIGDGRLIADDVKIHYTNALKNPRFGYMPGLKQTLRNLPEYDLYHAQGIWQYLPHVVAAFARREGKPYIITPRGMLYPQALEQSALIKKVSLALYQRKDLQNAAAIQATCVEEMKHYRRLGFTNPVAVIPNPIDTNGIIDRPIPAKPKLRIGYLGRIHPRKRIERLIYAFDTMRSKLQDAELLIIGADNEGYEKFLKDEVARLGLANVKFTGFLAGEEKDETITSLSCLAVPSDFENFGNIVTEALVRGVPVIASKGTPWQELEEYGCGWWVDNDRESINKAIQKVASLSQKELEDMGYRGKQLIKEKYSVEEVGAKLKSLYEWVLGQGEKPEFVYLD